MEVCKDFTNESEVINITFKRDNNSDTTEVYTDIKGITITMSGIEQSYNAITACFQLIKNEDINKELSFNDKIIKTLENDIDALLHKMESNLKNHNDSNYKMLINNLRDTVDLKQELEGKEKPTTINVSNISMPKVIDSEAFITELKKLASDKLNCNYGV